MRAVLYVIDLALTFYLWVIIVAAVLSWLVVFNVVNYRNQVVAQIDGVLRALTEPVFSRIRQRMPDTGAVDLSPLVAILVIMFIKFVIWNYIWPYVF
jgi:YggT family protein